MGKIKEFVTEHKGLITGAAVVTGAVVCGVAWYCVSGSTKVSSKGVDIDKFMSKLSYDNWLKRLYCTDKMSSARCIMNCKMNEFTVADLGKIGEDALNLEGCPEFITKDTRLTGVLILTE